MMRVVVRFELPDELRADWREFIQREEEAYAREAGAERATILLVEQDGEVLLDKRDEP